MKLHIIGGPGSGKTFIARHLAGRHGIPALDLDDIFWNHEAQDYGSRAEPGRRDAALAKFISQESWIVEGAYYRWLAPSFQAADRIIVLTPPRWLRQVRISRRFLVRKLGMDRGRKETLRNQLQLMAWNHKYDGDNLVRALTMLKESALSFSRCSTLADVLLELECHPS